MLIYDFIKEIILIIYANTKKQTLVNHSVAIAHLSLFLFQKLQFSQSTLANESIFFNIGNFEKAIYLAGIFHDIGKIDKNFQNFLSNKKVTDISGISCDGVHYADNNKKDQFSFLNYPRHNEVSWAFGKNLKISELALYAIYYHHAKVKRENKSNKEIGWSNNAILSLIDIDDFETKAIDFLKEVIEKDKMYEDEIGKLLNNIVSKEYLSGKLVPPKFLLDEVINYQDKKNQKIYNTTEMQNLLIRSLIISADRIISSLSVEELDNYLETRSWHLLLDHNNEEENNLSEKIEEMLERFKISNQSDPVNRERDSKQENTAKILAENNSVSTLFGPAGCGKTKIFLEWYKNKIEKDKIKRKLFIVTPRKMICSSLFRELTKDYLPNANIEIITGEQKQLYTNGQYLEIDDLSNKTNAEITITTIDQLISVMLSHQKIDMLLDFLNSYVVFDEFHEFFNIPGIVLLFKYFVKLKDNMSNAKTLLVSATPNYFFIEKVLEIKTKVEYMDTFNKSKYEFIFDYYSEGNTENKDTNKSDLWNPQQAGSIIIFNTATESQLSTISVTEQNVINFHSKFTSSDKSVIFDRIKKEWSKKIPASSCVLRAGPIVQASLNISTMNLKTQPCSAENWCQRVGRANRFGSDGIAKVTTVISDKTLSPNRFDEILPKSNENKFLKTVNMSNQTIAWLSYFRDNNFTQSTNSCIMDLTSLYAQYVDFHQQEKTILSYEKDFENIINKSLEIFENNDFTPIEYWKKKSKKKNNKLSSKSIRGKSVYVLPVKYDTLTKLGDWLYQVDENTPMKDMISLQENDFRGKSAIFNAQIQVLSNNSLSGFQNASYEKNYKNMNETRIKIEAKNSTSPILLSYPASVSNYTIYNTYGMFYVTKGLVKIGLLELSI